MFAMALTVFMSISIMIAILRIIFAISRGNISQLFKEDPLEEESMFDSWDLKNHGVSPGDIGYHRHFD